MAAEEAALAISVADLDWHLTTKNDSGLADYLNPVVVREQKITFGEMRQSGARGVMVFCGDDHRSHSVAMPANRWPDHLRLSDIEPQLVCRLVASAVPTCGRRRNLG